MREKERLKVILNLHGKEKCPTCGREIDRGDVAWNDACTDSGTPFSWVNIQCQACDTEICNVSSWWPGMDDFGEVLDVLDRDWRE